MKDDQFKSMDEKLSKRMKSLDPVALSKESLADYTQTVEERIRARQKQKINAVVEKQSRSMIWIWKPLVPTFAVALLFFAISARMPGLWQQTTGLVMPMVTTSTTDLIEEIAALKSMGVWTDEDDKMMLSEEEVAAAVVEIA